MRRTVLASSAMLAALVTAAGEGSFPADWSRVGNSEFRAAIEKLSGPDAIDCGIFTLVTSDLPRRSERRRALDCIADAKKRGVPFRYGTRRIPIDSFADEVYVQSVNDEAWMLVFDMMVVDNTYQMWIQRCQSVKVDPRTLIMRPQACEERAP